MSDPEEGNELVPVLLVDDAPANLLALEAVLSTLNVHTVTARSGKEALACIERETFAVALVDVQMPEMDGFELTKRLRETRHGRELPVLFVTAIHRDEVFVRKGYSAGAADYITKPYDPQVIRARVKAFIDLYKQRDRLGRGQVALRTQERDEALRRLVALERIATAALETSNLSALLSELLAAFVGAADAADSAMIMLREADFLRAAACIGFEQEPDQRVQIGTGFAGLIAEERRPLEINDEALSSVLVSPILLVRGLRALYGVPLLHDGQLLGVSYIGSSRAASFSQAEKRLFLAAAERASLAIAKQLEVSRLNEVLQSAPAKIAIVDAISGRYTFVNPLMSAVFGSDLVGTPHDQRGFGPEGVAAVARASVTGQAVHLPELELPHALIQDRAAPMYVRFTAQPLRDVSGSVDRILVFAIDVTAQVLARREIEAAQAIRSELLERERAARRAAEIASSAKDEFLATVSHELRTPLNSILGWASIARSNPNTDIERALSVIERNARAQARIVEDVLDFSRMSKGKMRLSLQNVVLGELVNSVLESVRPAAEAKGLLVEVEVDLAESLLGDPERLQQVVWNLLSNAVKYTSTGGRVHVRAFSSPGSTTLSVSDTGQGIDPDFLPHVFEPFRQADGSTTRRHGGLGLGLAIVRQIVDAHGGTIHAASDGLGRGSTFTIDLPSDSRRSASSAPPAPDEPAPESSRSTPDARLNGVRILLIDDDDDGRELMARALRLYGADVTLLSSADAALRELERLRPHVLVSDIAMPELDGYELIRSVRALPPEKGGTTPALAITAHAGKEVLERTLSSGFHRYASKPIDVEQFVSTVAELANPRRSSSDPGESTKTAEER